VPTEPQGVIMESRILKIDVSNRSYKVEEIPEKIIKQYLGGRGLGSYLLYNLVPAGQPMAPVYPIPPGRLSVPNHLILIFIYAQVPRGHSAIK
jgi:aldehyde:ferredoxin oxidoreductase